MDFINKHFRKSKTVKVIYFGEGKKHLIRYLIPTDSTINLNGKAFILNKDDFFVDSKNFITYVFSYNRVEPIDPNNAKTLGTLTPQDLGVALDSNVASQILSASNGKSDINILMMAMIFITLIGFVGLWYMLSNQIAELGESIKPILDVLS